jgi:3-oxoacyl-[acyl-carrier-protein] synthase II
MDPVPSDAFLITATTKGGIDNLERLRRGQHAEVEDISLSSITRIVSKKLGLIQEGFNISASCASSAIALAQGAGLIALGRTDAVLVCCIDLITEFTFSGFSSLRALSPVPCKPFDRDRQGLSLGEGAAALLLMSGERAKQENRRSLGRVLGWSIAGDAVHVTAPDKDGCGLIQAVLRALRMAGLDPGEITGVSAHGTGTLYNDLMELNALQRVFGKRRVPVYSVKGALGHSLGATGGIEIALGLQALSTRILPPTAGLTHPMTEAEGMVRQEPVTISGDHLLTTNSGFGGINAALVLAKC